MSLIAFFSGSLIPAMFVFTVQPPSEVKVAFEHRFANISDLKWHKENNHEYEASFKIAGAEYSANFDHTGKWLETESAIEFDQLPEKVKAAFNASYPGAKVKESAKIESYDAGTDYEVEFRRGGKTIELIYNPDGSLEKA